MIAVTFALPAESEDFVRLLSRPRTISRAGSEAICGELHGQTIAVVHTGVGERVCRPTVDSFLARQPVDYLVSGGFAGALDPDLHVGDLLIGENYSTEDLLRSPKLHLEEMSVYLANLTSARSIVSSADDRLMLAKESGAAAVDMETACIHAACAEKSVPMISLRAISDTAAEPFPAPPHILFDMETQRTPVGRLAFYLIKNPAAIPALKDFAARIATARHALTVALSALVRSGLP